MSSRFWRYAVIVTVGFVIAACAVAATELPEIGANALLHPARRPVTIAAPAGCITRMLAAADATLAGWVCETQGQQRGTLVYLHGIADNRESSIGIIRRFVPHGLAVVAYDSRAHGDSTGDACTYGYFEQDDLHQILDTVAGPVVLVGNSLGASVALQEAAHDPRVTAVVAIAAFSDLRTIATERAPFVFTGGAIDRAFARAEADAHFRADVVSPVAAARSITAPVLLVHGAADVETPPAHSERILTALAGAKRLLLVPGIGHNDGLPDSTWDEIERWILDRTSSLSSRGLPWSSTRADS
jgi:pimeloyl-ACP methyl ester carboxylesterase